MRRLLGIAILIAFLAVGSGAMAFVHLNDHLSAEHHEDPCEVCVQLHQPVLNAGWAPVLICLGLLGVRRLVPTPLLFSQPVLSAASCRGPPLC